MRKIKLVTRVVWGAGERGAVKNKVGYKLGRDVQDLPHLVTLMHRRSPPSPFVCYHRDTNSPCTAEQESRLAWREVWRRCRPQEDPINAKWGCQNCWDS